MKKTVKQANNIIVRLTDRSKPTNLICSVQSVVHICSFLLWTTLKDPCSPNKSDPNLPILKQQLIHNFDKWKFCPRLIISFPHSINKLPDEIFFVSLHQLGLHQIIFWVIIFQNTQTFYVNAPCFTKRLIVWPIK